MSQIVRSKLDLKKRIKEFKSKNVTIGLVPTMGALHQGHVSLIQMSKLQYDVTVATIFVNPTQFNNPEDLTKYPRKEKEDLDTLSKAGCDLVFIPSEEEIYTQKPSVKLDFGHLETIMEGKFRPSHFNGVGLIVMKLFGLVEPNGAYFGQKDLQQYKIISALVNEFEMPLTLHMAPIVREPEGLALSSRNERLSNKQKILARSLYSTLIQAKNSIKNGVSIEKVINEAKQYLANSTDIELEYLEIVDFETLQNISMPNEGDRLALCVAANVAGVRLIDNIIIEV